MKHSMRPGDIHRLPVESVAKSVRWLSARWIASIAIMVSALQAQSLENRIAKIRELVPPKMRPERIPSAGERLNAVLDQTRTRLRTISSDPAVAAVTIQEERSKLAVLNEAYETAFSSIEAKLRRANLPQPVLTERLAKWHTFTANYRKRMAASLADFDRVSQAAGGHDSYWVRSEAEKLRAGLGVASSSRITGVVDHATSKLQPHAATTAILPPEVTDPPTPDDLAANTAVVLTPDIVAEAASLGNSPAALFAYVYNNIQFVPYYMLVQNAESVFWSGKGNDADQATLLIALLRASGIPARYAAGYINVPVADAINWLGVKDKPTASEFLNLNTIVTDQGSSFQILHVWVEAWLNTPRGNAWVPMTPSIKQQTFQPGIILPEPVFNRTQFLSSVQTQLSSEIYTAQLLAAFQQAHPGQDFSALPYTGTITPLAGDTLPSFPYPPTQVSLRGSSLQYHTIGVLMGLGNTLYFSQSVSMPQVSTTSLTVGFTAATANDQSIINTYGGLANTPAGMVNLLPQLLVNEQVVATGNVPISYGAGIVLEVTHTESYATNPSGSYEHSLTVGENAAVTVGYNQISEPLVASRMDALLSEESTATSDEVARELVSIAGLRYFQRVEIEKQRVFNPLQIATPCRFLKSAPPPPP
jgi:transglutaminase-like putative cysteine protease